MTEMLDFFRFRKQKNIIKYAYLISFVPWKLITKYFQKNATFETKNTWEINMYYDQIGNTWNSEPFNMVINTKLSYVNKIINMHTQLDNKCIKT